MRGIAAVLMFSFSAYLIWGQFNAGVTMAGFTALWCGYVLASKLPR